MNLRSEIEKYLRSVMSGTAKVTASRIGFSHLDVARELNHMVADGLVEREKKSGNGNEYHYWLTRSDSVNAERQELERDSPSESGSVSTNDAPDELERAHAEIKRLTAENAALADRATAATRAAENWKANCAALEARIDELTLGPVGAKSPLFVTVGRYSKPKRHSALDKAQKRAAQLVRAEKESEVLILEPIGRIVRGTEWVRH